jgi:hypothetical protein
MKVLEKQVTLGEMEFRVATNRDIAIKTFEQFPDLMEYLITQKGNSNANVEELFINGLKNKELSKLFDMDNKLGELIAYALPLILKSANDNSNAVEIIDYAKENGANGVFNSAILEFLMQGFTQRELVEPKIKFSMK